jgi:hypothetical protein
MKSKDIKVLKAEGCEVLVLIDMMYHFRKKLKDKLRFRYGKLNPPNLSSVVLFSPSQVTVRRVPANGKPMLLSHVQPCDTVLLDAPNRELGGLWPAATN